MRAGSGHSAAALPRGIALRNRSDRCRVGSGRTAHACTEPAGATAHVAASRGSIGNPAPLAENYSAFSRLQKSRERLRGRLTLTLLGQPDRAVTVDPVLGLDLDKIG